MINIFAKRTTTLLCVMAVMAAINSCTFDDTDLQNSIDDLTSRVEALEDFQEQVQGDIASLQDIISKLNSSVTVNNVVDNGDGSWTINFSDGTSVTIRNGQDGEDGLTPPSITVVEEDGTYYWAYEDADGNTEFILDGDGTAKPLGCASTKMGTGRFPATAARHGRTPMSRPKAEPGIRSSPMFTLKAASFTWCLPTVQ